MTAPRITAEDISRRRSYAAIGAVYDNPPTLVVAKLARMVREDMDALESAWAANRILDDAAKDAQAFAYQAQEARAECDRLRAELDRKALIELSEECRGLLVAHGSDGVVIVAGEFSSGQEFREKYRLSAQTVGAA
jgi:hypothetical protein